MQGYKQAHMNLRTWGCRDAGKRIWTWRYKDVRMKGYKQVHTNIKIWGCVDAKIQKSALEPRDMRMWGARISTSQICQTCRLLLDFTPVSIPNDYVYTSRYMAYVLGIYLIIFWCTIHQTLPKNGGCSHQREYFFFLGLRTRLF